MDAEWNSSVYSCNDNLCCYGINAKEEIYTSDSGYITSIYDTWFCAIDDSYGINCARKTMDTNVVTDWQEGGDDGTNPIRVLVYAIPTILSIVGYRQIKEADDPVISFACNMGIMSTLLYCISTVTSGIFIGRLPIYCSLYATGILLPWELDNLFTKESTRIIWLGTIVGFLAFYYYQMHFTGGLI